jgi:ATP-dependent RNA helicase DDX3X
MQKVVKVEDYQKEETLINLLLSQPPSRTMIFVDSKRRADNLDDILYNKNFPCISLHGDRSQREREAAMDAFKTGRSPILITTSVASRGLDIKDVLHVINYDLCNEIDEYVHRIGRTARAGNPGLATTFYTDNNATIAPRLVKLLVECQQVVPEFLKEFVDEAT